MCWRWHEISSTRSWSTSHKQGECRMASRIASAASALPAFHFRTGVTSRSPSRSCSSPAFAMQANQSGKSCMIFRMNGCSLMAIPGARSIWHACPGRSVRRQPGSRRWDCLLQAVAADRWLRRYGMQPKFFVGVQKDTRGQLEAHAWLRCGDVIVQAPIARTSRPWWSRFPVRCGNDVSRSSPPRSDGTKSVEIM